MWQHLNSVFDVTDLAYISFFRHSDVFPTYIVNFFCTAIVKFFFCQTNKQTKKTESERERERVSYVLLQNTRTILSETICRLHN